jgi:hypothetical protein
MNKIICIPIIVIIITSGISLANQSINETEYWGVVVVAGEQSIEPYIYNAMIQKQNWKNDHIKLLWKENATTEGIFNSLDWLISNSDENDYVLFSVDAHGTYSNGDFGIWPYDGYDQGLMTVEELDNKFDEINAKGLCLIFDSCLSGSFVDNNNNFSPTLKDKNNIFRRSVVEGVEGLNRVVIMGTMPNGIGLHWLDYSNDGKIIGEISPTTVISEAIICENDLNNDGFTSAEEIFNYLRINYRKYAIIGFLLIPLQIRMYLNTGFFVLPFPTIYDNYEGEIPIACN